MHLITRKRLREFAAIYPDSEGALDRRRVIVKRATWSNFAEVRADFPQADQVGDQTVFNIGGNKYRLIAEINFRTGKLYVRRILTHREYDQGDWKV